MSYLDDMLNLAKDAMNKAYAPYSKYNVGAVIRGESGKLYCGCNVENAAYPSGSCAEQAAISAMILGGDIKISDILIISDGKALVSPCGACRQRIREFSTSETKIHFCSKDKLEQTVSIAEILPYSFGPENLDK